MAHRAIAQRLTGLQQILRRHAWGVGTTGFFLLLKASGATHPLALNQLDWMLRLRPSEPVDPNIVIVKIDQPYREWLRQNHGDRPNFEYQDLAELTQTIWEQEPAVVALDVASTNLSGQGREELLAQFRLHGKAMVATEKALRPVVPPIEGLPQRQLAFSDFIVDPDGKVRRVFLGTYGEEGDTFKQSLSFRMAELYLDIRHNIQSGNGLKDKDTVRFAQVEIPRLQPQQEPYSNNPNAIEGIQTLLNFRQQPEPFSYVSAQSLMQGHMDSSRLRDKIVLVGITAPVLANYLNTSVPRQKLIANSAFQNEISGIEFQAHAISQIVSAVMDEERVLVRGTHWAYSYVLILAAGVLGCLSGRASNNSVAGLLILLGMMAGSCFGLLLLLFSFGLYVSAVSALLTFAITGFGSAIALQQDIARQESEKRKNMEIQAAQQTLQSQEALLAERLKTLEDTFAELHNGPLQLLALLLRKIKDQPISMAAIEAHLQQLNQQIREVGEHLKQEAKIGKRQVLRHGNQAFDLSQPLRELFYDVYYQSLQADWPNLNNLKVRSRSFDPVPEEQLTTADKQALCQFLGEAICNVGKHAEGATRLSVSGRLTKDGYVLSIEDNGRGKLNKREGEGTRQAQKLATRLHGNFSRISLVPQGVRCIFMWPVRHL